MKGLPLNIKITTILAMAAAIVMSILGVYESWSQHHLTPLDPLFYTCMVSIVVTYMMASFGHPDTELKFNDGVRLKHLFRVNSYVFALVIIFGVNNPETWVQILHFVFTIAAVIIGYITLISYTHDTGGNMAFALIVTIFGLGGFAAGFFSDFISLAWGETIAAFPLAYFMYSTLK
jgi:hypothetical protein